jgi:hypothetical protein
MKYFIVTLLLLILISCNSKEEENQMDKMILGSTVENINNSQYSVIRFKINDEECFATINQYFNNFKYKSDFPYSLWISVETKDKNTNGRPTDKEAELYNDLEDSIVRQFDTKTPYCYIGRTTRNGFREIIFYVSDRDLASTLMDVYIGENKYDRKIEYDIRLDKNWESVSGLVQ